jgi:hypothetical protein
VWVLSVDVERKRVSLGMIKPGTPVATRTRRPDPKHTAASLAAAPVKGPAGETSQANSAAGSATAAEDTNDGAIAPAAAAKPPAKDRPASKPPASKPPTSKQPVPKRHAKPERPAPPLSNSALAGEEPLRTFGQLKQFWNKKET